MLLQRDGQRDGVIAAGLLHDVLEKTATSSGELQQRFGPRITRFNESVSDDPSISGYTARKRDLRARVAHADPHTATIFAADKVSKMGELTLIPPPQLRKGQFSRQTRPLPRQSLETLRQVAGDAPLVDLLDAEHAFIHTPIDSMADGDLSYTVNALEGTVLAQAGGSQFLQYVIGRVVADAGENERVLSSHGRFD